MAQGLGVPENLHLVSHCSLLCRSAANSMQQETAPNDYLREEVYALIKNSDLVLHTLEEAAVDALWIRDLQNDGMEWISDRFFLALGELPEASRAKGNAWTSYANPEDARRFNLQIEYLMKHPGGHIRQDVRFRHSLGYELSTEVFAMVICDDDKRPSRLVGIHRDLSQNRRNELLLEQTSRSARIGAWEWIIQSGEIYWSDMMRFVHEIDIPDWAPNLEQGLDFYHEDSRPVIRNLVETAVAQGEGWDAELQIVTAKGNVRWIRTIGQTEVVDGKTVRVYGSMQDIQEQKDRDMRLIESEQLLRQNFELAPNGMAIIDEKLNFRRVSRSLAGMLGFTRNELQSTSFGRILPEHERTRIEKLLTQLQDSDLDHLRLDLSFQARDGQTVICDTSIGLLRDSTLNAVSYHLQLVDITEQRAIAAARQRMAVLEDQARLMQELAYLASHDLRRPVLTLQGYLNAFEEDFGESLPALARQYLDVMHQASIRMNDMIKGLLDYSRISGTQPMRQSNLNILLAEVLEELDEEITGLSARIEIDRMPVLPGYPEEIRKVFYNLLSNALHYRKPGVMPIIRVTCIAITDGARICVSDNGIGISQSDQDRIFSLFQRVGPQGAGTGIGLASCRTIVERHGGSISVESSPGKGSTFCFTLLTDIGASAERSF